MKGTLKGKFSSGTEFQIIFKPLADCMIFKSKYNFVILELIGQPCCDLQRNKITVKMYEIKA